MLLFVVAVLVVTIAALIIYARWNYGFLESTGVPVIPPKFILGSDPDIHKVVLHEQDISRARKYGRYWGVYEGRAPHLYVTDPELIRLIMVKDFEHFHSRRSLDFGHELINEMLDVLPYDKWKTVRTSLTPSFTTGKIRLMSEQMKEATFDCVKNIDKEIGGGKSKILNTKIIFTALTTDVIARCAFGTKLNSINDPDNIFVKMLYKLNGDAHDPNFLLSFVLTFPFLAKSIPFIPTEAMNFFGGVLKDIMKARRESGTRQNDMVDAFNDLMAKVTTKEFQKLRITETTILCQPILFLFAGFDTTATTLTMLSYRLATNPDKQDKLIKELDELFRKNEGKVDHDDLRDLPYMNACINETLRMTPPLIRAERVCIKDWQHEDLLIKKGTVVQIPTHAVHYNEKHWPEPEKFIPERFLPENKEKINQYAFLSFGLGPRNCIGSRFAKEEINLVLALILKDYRFEAVPESKVDFKPGRQFLVQYQPVMIKITRR